MDEFLLLSENKDMFAYLFENYFFVLTNKIGEGKHKEYIWFLIFLF